MPRKKDGFIRSEETRAKMSAAKTGKPSGRKGVPISEETKAKLSEAHAGKTLSEAHKAAIGQAMRLRAQEALEQRAARRASRRASRRALIEAEWLRLQKNKKPG